MKVWCPSEKSASDYWMLFGHGISPGAKRMGPRKSQDCSNFQIIQYITKLSFNCQGPHRLWLLTRLVSQALGFWKFPHGLQRKSGPMRLGQAKLLSAGSGQMLGTISCSSISPEPLIKSFGNSHKFQLQIAFECTTFHCLIQIKANIFCLDLESPNWFS